ncbi:uncharacterized protein N7473_009362 [Penicillium subrubescens]|uniref:uncharacterized protein n=1 Tax=Penicillium subrubescens TaxID=1316194 RepID=UPI002544E326|nr:uncharacterized protein N7473_009362 [Penicillium subrubescens]KAJ5886688.1 hypothetical protein N7473_009362 [Penicillium subrubescens]
MRRIPEPERTPSWVSRQTSREGPPDGEGAIAITTVPIGPTSMDNGNDYGETTQIGTPVPTQIERVMDWGRGSTTKSEGGSDGDRGPVTGIDQDWNYWIGVVIRDTRRAESKAKETTAVLVNKPRVPPNGSHITLGCDCIGEIAAAEEEQPPLRIHRLRRDAIIRRPSQANACGYVAPISTAGKVQGLTTWRHGGCERPDLNLAPQ